MISAVVAFHSGRFGDGGLAVKFFFLIGGYFLVKTAMRGEFKEFVRPLYLKMLLPSVFTVLVLIIIGDKSFRVHDFGDLAFLFTIKRGGAGGSAIFAYAWFIGVYFWVSAFYFGVMKALPARAAALAIAIFGGISLLIWCAYDAALVLNQGVFCGFAFMGIGAMLGYYDPKIESPRGGGRTLGVEDLRGRALYFHRVETFRWTPDEARGL